MPANNDQRLEMAQDTIDAFVSDMKGRGLTVIMCVGDEKGTTCCQHGYAHLVFSALMELIRAVTEQLLRTGLPPFLLRLSLTSAIADTPPNEEHDAERD